MTAKDRMMIYLPPYYRESRVMNAIMEARGIEIDKFNYALNEILNQFFILTATWGLSFYEEKYGLPVNKNLDYVARRQRVLAKKRGSRGKLIQMLAAFDPTITLSWGRLIIPFTLRSDENIYNFGPLIAFLERRKPGHLGYTFRLQSSTEQSGYTVYAHHKARGKVNLELKAGSSMAGRWPWWDSLGQLQKQVTGIDAFPLTGDSIFYATANLYSGGVKEKSSVGIPAQNYPSVLVEKKVYFYVFPVSSIQCGITPLLTSAGSQQMTTSRITSLAAVGIGQFAWCGLLRCGEGVA